MANDESAIKLLLGVFAVVLITIGVQGIYDNKSASGREAGLIAVGVILALGSVWFPSATLGTQFTTLARGVAGDVRVWFGLVVAVLLYGMVTAVIAGVQRDRYTEIVEKDISPILAAMEKWVFPRRLTPAQIEAIGEHLRQFRGQTVSYRLRRNDDEAGQFRADLTMAVQGGGWRLGNVEYVAELEEGFRYQFRPSQQTAQQPNDPRNPKPDSILDEAFRKAGVPFDGASSGGGRVDQLVDELTIEIGPRPRGASSRRWRLP
jgi:hypothetical protein